MNPRFTRGEYWLLETVVEHEWSICGLMESDLELHLNKKGHGLTRASLLETLHRLISSGLIYAQNEVDGFISTYEQIERALDEMKSRHSARLGERKITYYGLTEEGGAQWEAFAAPDWEKYIYAGQTFSEEYEDGIWEVICADRSRLGRYYASLRFYHQLKVSLESIEWDYLSPWQVTYWKQLSGAYRFRFQERDKPEYEDPELSPPPRPEYFRSVWCAWR